MITPYKRMFGGYEIIHALHIGDREIIVGDNPNALFFKSISTISRF